VITKTKTKYPGITKITYGDGSAQYRLIIVVGKRADGRWIQECHTFRTMTEARAKQNEIKAAKNRGTLVKRDNVTFDELAQRWLDSRHDVREGVTWIGYIQILKPARAQLGQAKVQDISRGDIENLIRSLHSDRGLSHRTVVYTLGAIRQVLAYGISSGLLSINVAASVKAPRKRHSDATAVAVWEPAELIKFRAVADQDEWAAAWRLTLCGLRRSEVLGMMWDCVDLAQGEVSGSRLGESCSVGVVAQPLTTQSRKHPTGLFRWRISSPARWHSSAR
jgi:integrase